MSRTTKPDLRIKAAREAFVEQSVSASIANQITALREQRGWTRAEFARRASKPQSVVTRLEDPSYGRLNLQTLIEVANVFDVALQVRFLSFGEAVDSQTRMTARVPSYADEASVGHMVQLFEFPTQDSLVVYPLAFAGSGDTGDIIDETSLSPTRYYPPMTMDEPEIRAEKMRTLPSYATATNTKRP